MTIEATPDLALFHQRELRLWEPQEIFQRIARARMPDVEYRFRDLPGRVFRGGSWPAWCYIPGVVIRNMVRYEKGIADHPYIRHMYEVLDAPRRLLPSQALTAELQAALLVRWRLGKGCYRVHPRMLEALRSTPLEDAIPVDCLLHLPEWAVLVETPGFQFGGQPVAGFVAWLTCNWPHGEQPGLHLGLLAPHEHAGYGIWWRGIELAGETLGECRKASLNRGAEVFGGDAGFHWDALLPFLGVLLYLCSTNRDIRAPDGREFMPPAAREVRIKKKGRRVFAAQQISTWNVAWRIGAALDRADDREHREASEAGTPTGARVRPHLRKPHWHLYWTGKGRKVPRVRWLPPIPVNVEEGGETVPTVHHVG